MKQVDVEVFTAALEQALPCFDTRSAFRFEQDHVPGTRHLSLDAVQQGVLPEVERSAPVFLVCERGQISELVGLYLEAAGFTNVHNVQGGVNAWRSAGRVQETKDRETE
jgi:rhodanese-related sulfurtransferase